MPHLPEERQKQQKSFFARQMSDKESNPKLEIRGLLGRKLHSEQSNPKLVIRSFIRKQPTEVSSSEDRGRIHGLLKSKASVEKDDKIHGLLKEGSSSKIGGKARKL